MLKLKPNDVDFLMRTIVFALMLLAIMHAFKPYYTESDAATRQDVEQLVTQSRLIRPAQIRDYLANAQQPTMLVIYASWCPYCKQTLPAIYNLWRAGKIDSKQLLMVSVDSQATQLAAYLLDEGYTKMVGTPVMLKQNSKDEMSAILQGLGSRYAGGIPYIGFYGPDGQMRDELMGQSSAEEIESTLGALK